MRDKHKVGLVLLLLIAGAALLAILLQGANIEIFNPKGDIASQQRNLIIIATLLMLIVVVPVFMLTFLISWKYREGKKAKYAPNHDSDHKLEAIWWTVPLIIIIILSIIIWVSSHKLDPYKPLESSRDPITVQVVSLDWKWLFIYPDQNIATINYLNIPEDTPINFRLTSDAAMNSFWVPQLGGQVYTMAAMETKLHLIANEVGEYNGQSANISGEGFSGMKFKVNSMTFNDFDAWVQSSKQAPTELTSEEYKKVAEPSINNPTATYTYYDNNVYNGIISKYLGPKNANNKHGH